MPSKPKRPPVCKVFECGVEAEPGSAQCDWHTHVTDEQLKAPELARWAFTCMSCGNSVSSPWPEALSCTWASSGKLRCADCKGSVLLDREDVGYIGSPRTATPNTRAWRNYPSRVA